MEKWDVECMLALKNERGGKCSVELPLHLPPEGALDK